MARLQIHFQGSDTVISLKHGVTTVGRSNRCTINLPDPELADIQFRIQERGRGYRIKDDGEGGTGTTVNGKPVYATALNHGDVIEAGALRCVFLQESAPPPIEPDPYSSPAPAEPEERRRSGRAARAREEKGRSGLYTGIGAGLLAVVVAAVILSRGASEADAERIYKEAVASSAKSREQPGKAVDHLKRSVDLLEEIGRDYRETKVGGTAEVALAEARRVLHALENVKDEARFASGIEDESAAQECFKRLARMRAVNHPAVEMEVVEVEASLKESRTRRLEQSFRVARDEAEEHLAQRRFGAAARVWREFEISDYFVGRRAEEAERSVEKRIAEEYRGVLRLAGRNDDIDGRIGLLEASRATFRGTRHAEDLEVRISALKARKRSREIVVLKQPKKTPDKPTPDQPEQPVDTGPYQEPPKVVALVKARRYGEAASELHSITRHPVAKVRGEELTLLAKLMADLVAQINANPGEFDKVLLPAGKGRGDAKAADARFLTATAKGAEERIAWSDLSAKSFVRLFRQAGFEKPPRLATALFFDEELQPKEAAKRYVAFFKSEQAPETFNRLMARRRGIEAPAEGFLLFRNVIVTPREKATILLGERIEKLAREARTGSGQRRKAAFAELESIGEPARETFLAVLTERRDQAIGEIENSKAFAPQRFVAKFGQELERRRKHALEFIMDPVAYAYPNKTEAAQKEAEKRVDAVRELYERPYPLLLKASEQAEALDAEIRELDERLAKVDPLSEPKYEVAIERVVAKLDMRNVAVDERDRKRIAYNHEVMKYNRELKNTTVETEERANVTAVNLYRWMMGRRAVKIDERLVRAARKHSIEMAQLDYFAHDSPTPKLKSPGMRAKREGYGAGVAENIARGATNGVHAFQIWFDSSGHHRNMLIPGHTELGCGAFRNHWWTQKFGRMTGKSMSPPDVPPDPDPPGQSGNGMPAPDAKE